MLTMQQNNNQVFSSALDNLALAAFSENYVIVQIIASKEILTEFNKTLTFTIASMIQHGTGNRGQDTQIFEENQK